MTEKFWMWLAWRMPRKLVYFCGIRMWAHATGPKWPTTEAPAITADLTLRRWDQP